MIKNRLIQIKEISEMFDLPNLYIKDESQNETHLWKDRKAIEIIDYAKSHKHDAVALVSNGNFAYSLVHHGNKEGVRVVAYMDTEIKRNIKDKLKKLGVLVNEIDTKKTFLTNSNLKKMTGVLGFKNTLAVSYGFNNAMISLVQEIKEDIYPDILVVPWGSGDGLLGVLRGVKKLLPKTKVVAANCNDKYASKLHTYFNLLDDVKKETEGLDVEFLSISKKELKSAFDKTKRYIRNEPSSAVVFAALEKIKIAVLGKNIVVINSGQGLFD